MQEQVPGWAGSAARGTLPEVLPGAVGSVEVHPLFWPDDLKLHCLLLPVVPAESRLVARHSRRLRPSVDDEMVLVAGQEMRPGPGEVAEIER